MDKGINYIFSNLHIFKSAYLLIHTRLCLGFVGQAFAYFLICTLFFSCAQIVSPTGGPKDIASPKVLKYEPDSMPVNFKSNVIRLKFNEYIQLKDLPGQLVISPPMKKQPHIDVKGKDLVIELNDTLKRNTTYTLNFGNAITDITEGNPVENFQYVFSTGEVIDSLSLTGSVKNAFTLAPEKAVLVMLYDTFDDSVALKHTPNYFTKTKTDGSFKINYLRAGKYKVFALKDANSNYLYDSEEEMIAFSDTLVDVPVTKQVDLLMFKEVPKKQFVKKVSAGDCGDVKIILAAPAEKLSLPVLDAGSGSVIYDFSPYVLMSPARDTAVYWFPKNASDSIHALIKADDIVLDTILVKLRYDEQKIKLKALHASGLRSQDVNSPFELKFNLPVKEINRSKIELKINNSTSVRNKNDTAIVVFKETDHRVIKFFPGKLDSVLAETAAGLTMVEGYSPDWLEDANYELLILPGALLSIHGTVNEDTLKVLLRIREMKFYGTLKLKAELNNNSIQLIQFAGQSVKPVREDALSFSEVLNYDHLHPGNYSLRSINDTDKNQKWTTGNYFRHQQPEKVIYYPNSITIRSNWDLELEWKIE